MVTHKDDVGALASRLGYGKERLLEVIANAPKYYKPFHLESVKKDGSKKTRHIDNPTKKLPLRELQIAINKELLIPETGKLNPLLVGGVKKRKMIEHIAPHIGKKTIICMDLTNCFPNISYAQIVGVWRSLGYSLKLAKLLASATTFRGYLPQGAPTSSMLCNFALNPMASELEAEMRSRSLDYTQYIDDLSFSGDDDIVVREMVNIVYDVVPKYGQHINRKKTDIMDAKHKQEMMNIGLNSRVKVNSGYIDKVKRRIKGLAESGGIIDGYTNLSIGGQVLHVSKYDRKAGDHLEKMFSEAVQAVYDGGAKSKKEVVKPCWDYRKDTTHRAKCRHLVG